MLEVIAEASAEHETGMLSVADPGHAVGSLV